MSTILPKRVQDLLDFCAGHQPTWDTAHAAIGLTEAQADALKDALNAAQAAYSAAIDADDAKKAATLASQSAVRALRSKAAELLAVIKAYAENQSDPDAVYTTAQIPAPAAPSPVGPPGTPTDFTVGLKQDGSVELKWKCANPEGSTGTIYEVRRKIGSGSGGFAFIGASGVKSFTDDTLPSGSTGVTYQITAVRSTRRGNPAQFNVNFGVGGDGQMTVSVSPMKIAA